MSLTAAGRWLLHSGIQEPSGGFARFYDAAQQRNRPVSTEITGYAASALAWLFRVTGDEVYLEAARKTAAFLTAAWDRDSRLFPFEWPATSAACEPLAYFFDTGIIIRGLLAVWRETANGALLDVARAAALGMLESFRADSDFHPILALPEKTPLPRTPKWSRSSGCYQLKAAMAWWDVAEITGDAALRDAYLAMADCAMRTHACFLHEAADKYDAMDRLHAYAYFLEGLLPVIDRPECVQAHADGLAAMQLVIDEAEPLFVRSDVYAQSLRAGSSDPRVPAKLAAFQATSDDPRIDGGFWFGRRDGEISPQVNPVSTVFAIQALAMHADGKPTCRKMLI